MQRKYWNENVCYVPSGRHNAWFLQRDWNRVGGSSKEKVWVYFQNGFKMCCSLKHCRIRTLFSHIGFWFDADVVVSSNKQVAPFPYVGSWLAAMVASTGGRCQSSDRNTHSSNCCGNISFNWNSLQVQKQMKTQNREKHLPSSVRFNTDNIYIFTYKYPVDIFL